MDKRPIHRLISTSGDGPQYEGSAIVRERQNIENVSNPIVYRITFAFIPIFLHCILESLCCFKMNRIE